MLEDSNAEVVMYFVMIHKHINERMEKSDNARKEAEKSMDAYNTTVHDDNFAKTGCVSFSIVSSLCTDSAIKCSARY